MNYRSIPGLDKKASVLVFGCAGDVMAGGGDNSVILSASFENGINFFDTARCYGESEVSLGNWMKDRKNRHDVIVLSKGCHPKPESLSVHRVSADEMRADLDTSLKKLQTDYIDLYLLHRDNTAVPVAELLEALEEEKKKGKILSYGVSNWTLERFQEAQEYAEEHGLSGFSVNSPNYSLAEQVHDPWESGSEAISISGAAGMTARNYFRETGIPIIAYSSLARGLFSGKFRSDEAEHAAVGMDRFAMKGYFSKENLEILRRVEVIAEERGAAVSQVALAYLLSQDLQVHPVVAYSSEKHMQMNLRAADLILDGAEMCFLESGSEGEDY